MKLYKFRALGNCKDLKRIKEIIEKGFYCCDFLSFNDMNEGVFSINPKNIDITLLLKKQYKICSFSTKSALSSQLMWGHYANAGMGVAIEVEVKDSSNIESITYNDEILVLDDMKDILTRKSKVWEYENEVRYLSNEGTEDKVKIGKITKIYFGMPYKDLANDNEIKEEHKKLRKYLRLKKEFKKYLKNKEVLEEFCEGKSILCEDYHFNK